MRYDAPSSQPAESRTAAVAWVAVLAVVAVFFVVWNARRDTTPAQSAGPPLPDAFALLRDDVCGTGGHAQPGLPGYDLPSTIPGNGPVSAASASPSRPGSDPGSGSGSGCHDDAGGPAATDFVSIVSVQAAAPGASPGPGVSAAAPGPGVSAGRFVAECGRNENNHRNSDNFITAPGVSNGAHHVHDYVGNLTTDRFSTNATLAAGGTTCRLGDQSTYFWPVLRGIRAVDGDANADGGGRDGNVGEILRPTSVRLEFFGSAQGVVAAMPRFLRVITGDAKAVTNGPANARAQWTCSGFTNRVTAKYPLCPDGGVQRVLDFPSCWDGKNIDSANHRTHIVFPDQAGRCPGATRAVPRLRMTLTYSVPQGRSFAVDSFPEQRNSPLTDHGDFVNVMPESLMAVAVDCINGGRAC